MRILLVTGIYPPDVGGPATSVPLLAEELINRGHRVKVVTWSDAEQYPEEPFPQIPVTRISRQRPFAARLILTVKTLLREARNSDVLYANGLFAEAVLAAIIRRKPLACKVVGDEAWERAVRKGWTSRTFAEFQHAAQESWRIRLLRFWRDWPLRRAGRVILPSHFLARTAEGWGLMRSRLCVVPNSPTLARAREGCLDLPAGPKVAVVGRLVPWKHVPEIVEAVAMLDDVLLVIIGDGPEEEAVRSRLSELGLERRVVMAGRKPLDETQMLISKCDLLVLFSSYEGLPHVVLEAMALGIPVIASRVGGVTEIIADGFNGVLVEPGDTAGLRREMARILEDPNRRKRLSEAGRKTVRQWAPQRLAAEIEVHLREIVAEWTAGSPRDSTPGPRSRGNPS